MDKALFIRAKLKGSIIWECQLSVVPLTEVQYNLSVVHLISVWRLEGVLNLYFQLLCIARIVQDTKMTTEFLMSLCLGGCMF